MADHLIPCLFAGIALLTLYRKENAYEHLILGASDGLKIMGSIFPSLLILISAIHMLRASGAMESAAAVLSPLLSKIGVPPETVILMLVRPLSGSAALAIGADLMLHYGADSVIGRTAAVMLGSTETTFYTISVYFGACGVKKTRYALPAALIADIAGFLAASWTVRLYYR